jgi:RNA polymerase sigma-70 factor (ECF subfamily)
MNTTNDAMLMQRVADGDELAFAEIVDRYKNPLINYLTHLVRSRERAEDFAQEAFVRLYKSASKNGDLDRIGAYLYRIATNLVVTEVRRERRWSLLLPRLNVSMARTPATPDADLLADEIQAKVTAALERLPLKYRAPLVLYEIEEWPYDEIARALDCRLGTVKSRIARARELLRRQLSGWWNGGNYERHRTSQRAADTAAHERIATLHV